MTDEQTQQSDNPGRKGKLPYDPEDPRIFEVFANEAFIWVNSSDVDITFGSKIYIPGEPSGTTIIKPSVRIHLTHESMMQLTELLVSRYKMLQKVYGGAPPSINTTDDSVVKKAMDELLEEDRNEVIE